MDFGTLLHMAKKNSQDNKNNGKYYSTKFAPPKKESKEKKLSENIQKFLRKKDEEERRKQEERQHKVNQLLAMRDEKSKNKIRKMLKVTKSANRSVLEDAVNSEHTAVTIQGPDQPDQDDYGYVSTEANSFYQKYIDKVKDVKEDKGFAPSRPQSLKDLTGTKERVKAAITREIEEKNSHTRNRVKTVKESHSSGPNITRTSSKPVYDPEEEKRQEEEERKKQEAEKKKLKNRKLPPPPMDFQALLKLAEKKQHEPIELPVELKKKKDPERLMTMKEKQEMEERQKAKEARERRDRERNEEFGKVKKSDKDKISSSSSASSLPPRSSMEHNGKIPKLNQTTSAGNTGSCKTSLDKKSQSSSSLEVKSSASSSSSNFTFAKPSTNVSSASSIAKTSPQSSSAKSSSKSSASSSSTNKLNTSGSKNPASSSTLSKQPYNGSTKEFSTRDNNSVKSREFPPRDIQKSRQLPQTDVRKGSGIPGNSKKSTVSRKRILDDDDSEYDSELDDFIDDGEDEEDYSSHIKAIFGYDRSRYRDDDYDDDNMESNFAQVQREEYISKKIGIKEDLEDMKMEAMEKKRKMMMKKRRLN